MPFQSFNFLCFFLPFFFIYWLCCRNNVKFQNLALLSASYLFYFIADWRFLAFLILVSAVNFILGILIGKEGPRQKAYFLLSIFLSIGGLMFFKYFNFFTESVVSLFAMMGFEMTNQTARIIAPIGISFFSFRILSYLFDVNKGKIKAQTDWLVFFNYIAFFPTIMAGPIDRARDFFPQLSTARTFSYPVASEGCRQILWGLFKKIVIADNLATITSPVFAEPSAFAASALVVVMVLYAFQIYADFSGYSDMAIGIGKILGFRVTKNFQYPYFARNIAEFWRRWHISLTNWLTEYLYTPLALFLRHRGTPGQIVAIVVNLTICGLWHGPNWTFVVFGLFHGCLFIPLILWGKTEKKTEIAAGRILPSVKEVFQVGVTFTLVALSLVVFRSHSIGDAFVYFQSMISVSIFSVPYIPYSKSIGIVCIIAITFMMTLEWFTRQEEFALSKLGRQWKAPFRWALYYALVFCIFYFKSGGEDFIYVQF